MLKTDKFCVICGGCIDSFESYYIVDSGECVHDYCWEESESLTDE